MAIEKFEGELTVNEMVGACKYVMLTTPQDLDEYMSELEEYQEMGMGETTVADCKQVLRC